MVLRKVYYIQVSILYRFGVLRENFYASIFGDLRLDIKIQMYVEVQES